MSILNVIHKVTPETIEPVVSFSIRKIMENSKLERVPLDIEISIDNNVIILIWHIA